MMRVHALFRSLPLLVAVVASGCGSSDQLPVYRVRGTVTLEGKSMPGGGSIAFVPLKQQAGKTAGGEINEDGTYVLSTYGEGDGSIAGEFRVVITQAATIEPTEAPPDGQPVPEGGQEGVTVAPEDRIPPDYSDSNKSPLRATVKPNGSNEINFDLKRKLEPAEGSQPPGVAWSEFPGAVVAVREGSSGRR